MIAKLTGVIDRIGRDFLILDVNGVGYHVFASARTLSVLGSVGARASLYVETHVREDHIHLFGFASAAEQEVFKLLTSVQGVGARTGLALLSVAPPDKILFAIAAQDKAVLTQAEGVGPKLAVRILTELKDKAASLSESFPAASLKPVKKQAGASADPAASLPQDAVSALVNLGYGRAEAYEVVYAVYQANDNIALSDLLRLSLKELSS